MARALYEIYSHHNDTENRFKVVTETEISNTLKKRIPANTSSNTSFAMNTYRKWVEFRNRQPETALDPFGPFVPCGLCKF